MVVAAVLFYALTVFLVLLFLRLIFEYVFGVKLDDVFQWVD